MPLATAIHFTASQQLIVHVGHALLPHHFFRSSSPLSCKLRFAVSVIFSKVLEISDVQDFKPL